jgi:hypothetical protein
MARTCAHLASHLIGQQVHVSRIDIQSVLLHDVLNLAVDRLSSGLDSEHTSGLHDIVGFGPDPQDTCSMINQPEYLALMQW